MCDSGFDCAGGRGGRGGSGDRVLALSTRPAFRATFVPRSRGPSRFLRNEHAAPRRLIGPRQRAPDEGRTSRPAIAARAVPLVSGTRVAWPPRALSGVESRVMVARTRPRGAGGLDRRRARRADRRERPSTSSGARRPQCWHPVAETDSGPAPRPDMPVPTCPALSHGGRKCQAMVRVVTRRWDARRRGILQLVERKTEGSSASVSGGLAQDTVPPMIAERP